MLTSSLFFQVYEVSPVLCPPLHAVPALGARSISWEGTHDTEHPIPLALTPGLCAEHALVASCGVRTQGGAEPPGQLGRDPWGGMGTRPMDGVCSLLAWGRHHSHPRTAPQGDTAALIGVVLPSLGCAPGVMVPRGPQLLS